MDINKLFYDEKRELGWYCALGFTQEKCPKTVKHCDSCDCFLVDTEIENELKEL